MNLILSHPTEKKFDLISLRLLSSSVSSHPTKKNPVLSHPIKKKSHPILILTWDRTRSGQEILILAVSLDIQQLWNFWHDSETSAHMSMTFLIQKVLILCVKIIEDFCFKSYLTESLFSFFNTFWSAQIHFQSCQHDWQLHHCYSWKHMLIEI